MYLKKKISIYKMFRNKKIRLIIVLSKILKNNKRKIKSFLKSNRKSFLNINERNKKN